MGPTIPNDESIVRVATYPRTPDHGHRPQRRHDAEQARRDFFHRRLDVGLSRPRIVVRHVALVDVQGKQGVFVADEVHELIVHRCDRSQSSGVHHQAGEFLHERTFDPGGEIQVTTGVELLLAVSGDDAQVFLRGLDEVDGGNVRYGFAIGMEE